MEKRKESLSDIKLCRFCLTQDSSLTSLYDRSRDPILVTLPLKIMACVSIEVFPSDKMPSYICERCRTFMDICYDFKQICRRADESCLQFVQNGIPVSAVSWPPSLTKIFNLTKKARPINTVVEGGATIQVTSQEMSENEEDEETYNIKWLRYGHRTWPSVRQLKEAFRCRETAVRKGVMVRVRRRSAGLGSWPCEQCDRSYPLHQLLEIHMAQKHRARNVQCTQCDAKFFSKYDLMTHQLRHTNEMPFQCVACDKKFKRLILLKRHEKMVHVDLPKHLCPNCPAKFLSMDELEAHKKRHEGYFSRQHVCTVCDRKHLRLKHEEQVRLARGADAEFRCEQCGESFGTQDDLYYHSAIHATQNLICPLCQEKFENVDAVTTHIRTHVNGIEFMCEYCELVFTSKEKLDSHMAAAHEDELTPRQELGLDESSVEADAGEADVDADDDDEDNGLNVKEEDDHMVVEIKKADGYMLRKDIEVGQTTNTNSEDSEMEATYTELSTVDTLALARAGASQAPVATKSEATSSKASRPSANKTSDRIGILRKAEAIKRKAAQKEDLDVPQKKERTAKVDSTTPTTTLTTHQLSSDKSLRLLEKELQELTRTPWRSDGKTTKFGEAKSKRQPVHTSTPKLRSADEKKAQITKIPAGAEKKAAERRPLTKDSKEPKESKEARNTVTSTKEDKSVSSTKDDKPSTNDKEDKTVNKEDRRASSAKEHDLAAEKLAKVTSAQEQKNNSKAEKTNNKEGRVKAAAKDVPSASNKVDAPSTSTTKEDKRSAADKEDKNNKDNRESLKNGDTSSSEENVVRRSTRPSKIKNYASMIRDRTRMIRDEDDDEENSDDDSDLDKETNQVQTNTPSPATRRRSVPKRKAVPAPPSADRRRGRPRKEALTKDVPEEEQDGDNQQDKGGSNSKPEETKDKAEEPEPEANKIATADLQNTATSVTSPTSTESQPPLSNMLVSPTGQTLKKVPIKALPPGIKPLPLPINARTADLCQMQIGKKMVKVQKIVMTKAEVEAMAKKGLLELKDGTMVLKQGIKLPGADPAALRSGLVSPGAVRKVSATPMRCTFDGEEA
ncbi:hypothetical protein MSG28_000394 [Choristoneura fumiferana]|uniref:Uncharacterized protein n=1 Tax=Choristoneura fumiferana TaxID=7141 RepID=A0ACC0K153_CHOFU|nr:hypothetical protein MSG28_000394 [Choristoneura fumiferana]